MTDPVHESEFVVAAELGLHARPAGRFVSRAGEFRAEGSVARDEEGVSGRSVLSLLSLAAAKGTRLRGVNLLHRDTHSLFFRYGQSESDESHADGQADNASPQVAILGRWRRTETRS